MKTANTTVSDPEGFLAETKSPLLFFSKWYDEGKALGLRNPDAMLLSTCGADHQPRARVVLLKEQRENGLVFYTNYQSQKGRDLQANPNCSLTFYWDQLFRQVHFNGRVEKISREDSVKYWQQRPRLSQMSQWVSKQSQKAHDRLQLENELRLAEKEFSGRDVPCPAHWGGYIFVPTYVEFWIGREGRFHDRYSYQLVESKWQGARLYP